MDCGNHSNDSTYDLCGKCLVDKHTRAVGHSYFETYPDSDLHCLAWYKVPKSRFSKLMLGINRESKQEISSYFI